MKGLFYLVVTMVVIIACTNEEFDANCSYVYVMFGFSEV